MLELFYRFQTFRDYSFSICPLIAIPAVYLMQKEAKKFHNTSKLSMDTFKQFYSFKCAVKDTFYQLNMNF